MQRKTILLARAATVILSVGIAVALPNLTIGPTTLSFTYQIGGTISAAQTISVASGTSGLSYTASVSGGSWLTALPVSGTMPGSISVSVSPQGLTAGVYSGDVIIQATGAGNAPQIVAVSLTVLDPTAPQLTATPASLTFNYAVGGTAPAAQSVSITSAGPLLATLHRRPGGHGWQCRPPTGRLRAASMFPPTAPA